MRPALLVLASTGLLASARRDAALYRHLTTNLSLGSDSCCDDLGDDVQAAWTPGKPLPVPADETLWCKSVSKGSTLMDAMSYNDADAGGTFSPPRTSAKSLWDLDHLFSWGWNIEESATDEYCDLEGGTNRFWGIAPFLRSKGVSSKCADDGGHWDISQIFHGDEWENDEPLDEQTYEGPDQRQRRVTGAEFIIGVNGQDGGCMTFARQGCEVSAVKLDPPVPPSEFPSLRQSSDMLWALWEKNVPEERQSSIKFFMTLSIVNEATLRILRRALMQTNRELTNTPVSFATTSEEGRAILGSPNAIAFSYMLIQHKDVFGNRIIDRVEVFEGLSGHKSPVIFFNVRTYPNNRKPPTPAPSRKKKRSWIRNHKVMMMGNETLLC